MEKKRASAVFSTVRFPPGQYAMVAARARERGMTVSAFVRFAALVAAGSTAAREDRLKIQELVT